MDIIATIIKAYPTASFIDLQKSDNGLKNIETTQEIEDLKALQLAIRTLHFAKDYDKRLAFIKKQAKKLELSSYLPKNWQ